MNQDLPLIYPITDTRLSGISQAEQVSRIVKGGGRFIQVREKHASPRDFFAAACEAVAFAREHRIEIIINDRVDIAVVLKANGVHLGQNDLPPQHARKILGEKAIIGFSVHSAQQAAGAVSLPIDYIAVGPIFETHTKENPDAIVGLEGLSEVRALVGDFPLVAIGGITRENLLSVFDAGADSAAIISSLISDPPNITSRMDDFIRLANSGR